MTAPPPERWERIDAVLQQALEHPTRDRTSFVVGACGDDAELRHEVLAMLENLPRSEDILNGDAVSYAEPLLAAAARTERDEPAAGARFGPYRVLRAIGRGGMGAVYLGERADGEFDRRVAIKIVKRGMDTDEILRRFHAERGILATMEHPHIARLYDAGAAEDGRPYLVMEYVEGQPITHFCDARKRTVEERLSLFREVCRAVQHAHQNLVIHRDVKPANLLVTDDGEPKLLDFGVAKLLSDDPAADPATRSSVRMLTPEYAAPEQLGAGTVTTATDVYALGAILFELMTGERPPAPGSRGSTEAPRSIKASAAVSSAQDVAEARGTTTIRLRRRLEGDIDALLAKALEPLPARRYGTASELADEIGRVLDGLPLEARPGERWYRASRFLRRQWHSVSAAAVLVLSLAAFSVISTVERARTDEARRVAEEERRVAEQVADFLAGLFAAPDPFASRPERLDTLRVGALLDRGAERVRDELADQPVVQARMMRTMGSTYRSMGRLDEAAALLEEAVTVARGASVARAPELADALNDLGLLELARGRNERAEALHREALELRRGALGDRHPDVRPSLVNLAATLQNQGRLASADSLYRMVDERIRADEPPDSLELADVLNARAVLAHRLEAPDEAIRIATEAMGINRSLLGPTHPRTLRELHNVAFLNNEAGHLDEAEARFREAVVALRDALGPDHPNVAVTIGNLARVLRRQDQPEEAMALFEEAAATLRRVAPRHADTATLFANQASFLRSRGEHARAHGLFREALDIARGALGPEHPMVQRLTEDVAETAEASS